MDSVDAPSFVYPDPYDRRYVPEPFGLYNNSSRCHLNSLLQAIIGCSSVIATTLKSREYLSRTATGRAFYDFVFAAISAPAPPTPASPSSASSAAPAPSLLCPPDAAPFNANRTELGAHSAWVLAALIDDLKGRHASSDFGSREESASEGLVLLLDMMDDPTPALVAIDRKTAQPLYEENPIARLFYHRYEIHTYCSSCHKAVSKEDDIGVQFNLFHYNALPCAPTPSPEAFGDMLRAHNSPLEGYVCSACSCKNARGFRAYVLRMVPEVLVVVFNLYDASSGQRPIRRAPTVIALPGNEGTLFYRQVAQVEHFGGLGGGHYVTRGLRSDGRVYRFNDDHAAPRTAFEPSENSYMLFYHHDRTIRELPP